MHESAIEMGVGNCKIKFPLFVCLIGKGSTVDIRAMPVPHYQSGVVVFRLCREQKLQMKLVGRLNELLRRWLNVHCHGHCCYF